MTNVKKEQSNTAKRLPGEFELNVIHCGERAVRGSLMHYYAIGGKEGTSGIFQGKILRQENGWTLLKHLTVRFAEMDMNYNICDVVGVEDHVWIYDTNVTKNYKAGDNIEFSASTDGIS